MVEIGRLTFIRPIDIRKRHGISQLRFQKFIRDDMATSCTHLV